MRELVNEILQGRCERLVHLWKSDSQSQYLFPLGNDRYILTVTRQGKAFLHDQKMPLLRKDLGNCISLPSFEADGRHFRWITRELEILRFDWEGDSQSVARLVPPTDETAFSYSALHAPTGRSALICSSGKIYLGEGSPSPFERLPGMDCLHHEIGCIAFSPDGNLLAVRARSGAMCVFDWKGRKLVHSIEPGGSPSFSPGGEYLLVGEATPMLQVFRVADWIRVFSRPVKHDSMAYGAISPDGKLLATVYEHSEVARVTLWELPGGRKLACVDTPLTTKLLYQPKFDAAGKSIMIGSLGDGVWSWRIGDRANASVLTPDLKETWSVAVSPTQPHLAVSVGDGIFLRFHDLRTNALVGQFVPNGGAMCYEAAFSPDGRHLALACYNGRVKVFELTEELSKPKLAWEGVADTRNGVRCLAYSHDGKTIATGAKDSTIILWDATTGERRRTIGRPLWLDSMDRLAFSRDDSVLVAKPSQATVYLWRVGHWDDAPLEIQTEDEVQAVAVHPFNDIVVLAGSKGAIGWHTLGGQLIHSQVHCTSLVRAMVFSADGRTLATGGEEGTIHLWDGRTSDRLLTLPGHDAPIYSLAFSNGPEPMLVSGDHAGALRVWKR